MVPAKDRFRWTSASSMGSARRVRSGFPTVISPWLAARSTTFAGRLPTGAAWAHESILGQPSPRQRQLTIPRAAWEAARRVQQYRQGPLEPFRKQRDGRRQRPTEEEELRSSDRVGPQAWLGDHVSVTCTLERVNGKQECSTVDREM